MSQAIGIRSIAALSSAAGVRGDQTFTSNATLATVGLSCAIAANETKTIDAIIIATVGATGGLRAQLVVPAGSTAYNVTFELENTVAPSTTTAALLATAAFTNALANAGTHFLKVKGTIVNGATAGTIDLQMAQNTVDVLPLVVRRGSNMQIVSY